MDEMAHREIESLRKDFALIRRELERQRECTLDFAAGFTGMAKSKPWDEIVEQARLQGHQHRSQQSVKAWLSTIISLVIGGSLVEGARLLFERWSHT